MIRFALLSFWHVHAADYLADAAKHPATEVVAAWDEQPSRGQVEASARGLDFYADLGELLARPDVDGVIVTAPTSLHPEVLTAAARAGKHIFTEKVVAATLADTRRVTSAAAQAGVKLMVSLPRLYAGYTQTIREAIGQELLGELTQVRARVSHSGALPDERHPGGWLPEHFYNPEETGGGALIDFGCHPLYLTRLLLGMPERVSATYGYVTGRQVEDNAVVTFGYASGAIGVVEAGFVNRHSPSSLEVHGTEGSLLFGTPHPKLLVRSERLQGGAAWQALELRPDQPTAFERWVEHIKEGTTATENLMLATDLSALVEGANCAAASGRVVKLAELDVVKPGDTHGNV